MEVDRRTNTIATTFFGVGAQCSGTSWLTELLREYPDVALPYNKELHILDSLFLNPPRAVERYLQRVGYTGQVMRLLERKVQTHLAERPADAPAVYADGFLAGAEFPRQATKLLELVEQLQIYNLDSFVAYLERLRERKRATIVGEFTPAYALLPAEAFRAVDERFPGCRLIYIMRDPVQRFWSQARHGGSMTSAFQTDPNKKVKKFVGDFGYIGRSDYQRTIETMESVIPRERIFYAFYERITSPNHIVEEMRSLERFLGLNPLPEEKLLGSIERPVNVSAKIELTPENRQLIRDTLAPIYAFIEKRFGALPDRWARE